MMDVTCPPLRFEPPTRVPEVTSSLANFFARPDRNCAVPTSSKFTVWLDHTDRIISLPPEWDSLATVCGLTGLKRESVLGRPVGRFIADESMRACYRMLLENSRRSARTSRIIVRCDSPDETRAMQLRFIPMAAGAIECSWFFFRGTTAEDIPLVRPQRFSDGEYLRMCSWCRQVHIGGDWHRIEAAAPVLGMLDHGRLPAITHGICLQCRVSLLAENTPALEERVAV